VRAQSAEITPPADTREKILDAAELLFIERGFAATSLRAIASRAGVNLAATHYHFGSKSGLLAAVFHRRVSPINEQRLSGLRQLTEDHPHPTCREILETFFAPFMRTDLNAPVPAVIGRIHGEPETVTKPLLENEFAEVAGEYEAALSRALPDINRNEIRWRCHFMVGSLLHLLRLNSPLGVEPAETSLREGLERLIDFSLAGLEQASGGARNV
jgi:AcrR family transcriptional regulator